MKINERNKLLVKELMANLKNGKLEDAIETYIILTGENGKEARYVCCKYVTKK